jgi:hypothetical protein
MMVAWKDTGRADPLLRQQGREMPMLDVPLVLEKSVKNCCTGECRKWQRRDTEGVIT